MCPAVAAGGCARGGLGHRGGLSWDSPRSGVALGMKQRDSLKRNTIFTTFSQHAKCNTNPIVSDLTFFVLNGLQGRHGLDSANQVEVFTEPSVYPQA